MYGKNNLDKSKSPYLNQHKSNPIWWQEFSEEVLQYASENKKLVFISIGYSTCHWCHEMAKDSFSDIKVANYLNENFVCIKADKEENPDLNQLFMNFSIRVGGPTGWPLNVFLSPNLEPIFACTYMPSKSTGNVISFLELLEKIKDFYEENSGELTKFSFVNLYEKNSVKKERIVKILRDGYDYVYGGFLGNNKFPNHSTLQFMLYFYSESGSKTLGDISTSLLDIFCKRGLQDHLGGGFFRYCIGENFEIPHFEKMLYDQAMMLWNFSLSYRLFKKDIYKKTAFKIVKCLEKYFETSDGLYYSGIDADTDHIEGGVYLWSYQELEEALSSEEFEVFKEHYDISVVGNFSGKNHLVKKDIKVDDALDKLEDKLIKLRDRRRQAFVDKKVITSWNALLGVAYVNAYRYFGESGYLQKAKKIYDELLEKNFKDGLLYHNSIEGDIGKKVYMEDYSAVTLLLSFLYEELGEYEEGLLKFSRELLRFKANGIWLENRNEVFGDVEAEFFDQPIPCSLSVAELALKRKGILLKEEQEAVSTDFLDPFKFDFYNIKVMLEREYFHIFKTPEKLNWNNIPLNSVQVSAEKYLECHRNSCYDLDRY